MRNTMTKKPRLGCLALLWGPVLLVLLLTGAWKHALIILGVLGAWCGILGVILLLWFFVIVFVLISVRLIKGESLLENAKTGPEDSEYEAMTAERWCLSTEDPSLSSARNRYERGSH